MPRLARSCRLDRALPPVAVAAVSMLVAMAGPALAAVGSGIAALAPALVGILRSVIGK